jgi:hypothetical protein
MTEQYPATSFINHNYLIQNCLITTQGSKLNIFSKIENLVFKIEKELNFNRIQRRSMPLI